MGKADARSWTKQEQQDTRNRVIQVMRETLNVAETARRLHVSRRAVYNWLNQRGATGSLQQKPRGGYREGRAKPRVFTSILSDELLSLIASHKPCELGSQSQLWSIKTVRELVESRYGLRKSNADIKHFLREQGLIPPGKICSSWCEYVSERTDK